MTRVYQQLAQQLVVEQAELMQKEVVVNGLKKAIAEKKLDIIHDCIRGASFKIGGDKVMALKLMSYNSDEQMTIGITFGIDPKSITLVETKLTKREKRLWQQYKDSFEEFRRNADEEEGLKALETAHYLHALKHKIRLWIPFFWEISYDEATKPEFFEKSGLTINEFRGRNPEPLMLEDVRCRRDFRR